MENSNNSYSHILKYTSLFGGVQMLNILIGLVRNKLVAVLLGPAGMGLVALFSSTIKLVVDSTNFGLHISAVRNISMAFDNGDEKWLRHEIEVFRHWILITALFGLVVCAALSSLLSDWTFSFGDHTLHFVLLSPVVALTTLTVGETAILKATRRLKALAVTSIYGAIGVFAISVPIYWIYNYKGIVPSLVLMALVQAIIVLQCSLRLYPLQMRFRLDCIKEGTAFLRLGIAFVVAGMLGSGAELAIRAYLSNASDVDTVGLYNAMYVMIFTYAGMVFTAIDTDYYPRLSAIKTHGDKLNDTVNNQIEVSMNIVSPLIVLFILFMPILLPLLYSGKFNAVIPMLQVAALSMYGRGVFLPLEYIALSRGNSMTFLTIEIFSDVVLASLVILGFNMFGLLGIGIAITTAYMLEMLFARMVCRIKYKYRMSSTVVRTILFHLAVGICVYASTHIESNLLYCIVGTLIFCADAWFSLNVVKKHTAIMEKLKGKFKKLVG